MKLYYFPTSHWSRVIHIALRELADELGLEFDTQVVDLTQNANYAPDYLALNPRGVVPTLDDGGEIVWDSRAIIRHLDATYANGRLHQRCHADVRAWADKLHELPLMLFSYAVWVLGARGEKSKHILADKVARARDYAERYPQQRELYLRKAAFFEAFSKEVYDDAHVEAEHQRWRGELEALGEFVRERQWIGGAQLCFADCIAASVLARLVDLERGHDWYAAPGHPLRAYFERLRAHPAVRYVYYEDPKIPARFRLRVPSPPAVKSATA